jgi:spermidine/putrescine-binding protein
MGRDFDPNNIYSAPYKWGTVGILYNSSMVNHEVYSWESLFNPDYAGQILMYNSERDAFVPPLALLGASLNTTDPSYINAARDMLIDQMPLVQAYVTDIVIGMMINGDAAMALVYSGDASWTIRYNEDLRYVIPQEGSNLWINSLVIPQNAQNPRAAEAFINFLLRPDIAGQNTNWVGYTTANVAAIEGGYVMEELTRLESFNITPEDLNRLEVFVDLGDDRELITQAFTEVLASGN